MTPEPKPAAALTADRIRRVRDARVGAAMPDEALSAPSSSGSGGRRFWRRAGLFGLVYLAALAAFAAAFDVWPTAGR